GDAVVGINRDDRVVSTASGRAIAYDRLVFATGSSAFMPAIPGIDLPGVYPYRTIDDLEAMIAGSAGKKTGTVIGGGLLGLEAAKALKDLGLQVAVIDHSATLMHRQLDHDAGSMLRKHIE